MPLARQQLAVAGFECDRLVFVDDGAEAGEVNGHQVFSWEDFLSLPASGRFAVLAIADGKVRQKLAHRLQDAAVQTWSVVSGGVVEMDEVVLGEGAAISPFVTLTSNIRIGKHFHANLYSYVEHDCVIGDYVTFAPRASCNGNVHIEDFAYIGAGAVIKQGTPDKPLVIGEGAVIGMGAVVTKSVPAGVTVVGNPARLLK